MPISPYTIAQPIQFEYKPLGLEAFAKPLEKMQAGYDKARIDVENLQTKIDALSSSEKDKAAASQLQGEIEGLKSKLIDELYNKKNYRQANQWIAKANKWYNEDPHRLALLSNIKKEEEYDKRDKEMMEKGDLSVEDYKANKQRRLAYFEKSGGTDFKDKDNYKQIQDYRLTKDLDKEFQENLIKLVDMTPEQLNETIGSMGDASWSAEYRERFSKNVTEKNTHARKKFVKELLEARDDYKEYFASRADLKYDLANLDDDQFKKMSSGLITKRMSDIDNHLSNYEKIAKGGKGIDKKDQIAAQQYLESDEAKGFQKDIQQYQEMLQGSKAFDPEEVKYLNRQQYENEKYKQLDDAAGLLYKKGVTYDIDKVKKTNHELGLDGNNNPLVGNSISPFEYPDVTPNSLVGTKNSAKNATTGVMSKFQNMESKHIFVPIGTERKLSNGVTYKKADGGKFVYKDKNGVWKPFSDARQKVISKEFYAEEMSDPVKRANYSSSLYNALYDPSVTDAKTLKKALEKQGLKVSDYAAEAAYKEYKGDKNKDNLRQLGDDVNALRTAEVQYSMAEEANTQLLETLNSSTNYNNKVNEIANNVNNIYNSKSVTGSPKLLPEGLIQNSFPKLYKELQKSNYFVSNPGISFNTLLSKLGYSDVKQAIKAGALDGLGEVGKIRNATASKVLEQNPIQMGYQFINNKVGDKVIEDLIPNVNELLKYNPIEGNWLKTGVSKDGKTIDPSKVTMNPKGNKWLTINDKIVMGVGVSYVDPNGQKIDKTVAVLPMAGDDKTYNRTAGRYVYNLKAAEEALPADKQNKETLVKLKNILLYNEGGVKVSDNKIINVGSDKGISVVAKSHPYDPSIRLEVVQVTQGNKDYAKPKFKIVQYDTRTKKSSELPNSGNFDSKEEAVAKMYDQFH